MRSSSKSGTKSRKNSGGVKKRGSFLGTNATTKRGVKPLQFLTPLYSDDVLQPLHQVLPRIHSRHDEIENPGHWTDEEWCGSPMRLTTFSWWVDVDVRTGVAYTYCSGQYGDGNFLEPDEVTDED